MPAAAFVFSHTYGPACAASVQSGAGSVVAGIKGYLSPSTAATGAASTVLLKPTRLRNSPMTVVGLGEVVVALPKKRVRPAMLVKIGELSQDDVTGAVLEAKVDGDQSLKQVLAAILAAVTSGGGGSGTGGGLTVDQAAQLTAIQSVTGATSTAVDAQSALLTAIQATTADVAEAVGEFVTIHGLTPGSPLTVTATSRSAGGITQTISESGGTVTVTRT